MSGPLGLVRALMHLETNIYKAVGHAAYKHTTSRLPIRLSNAAPTYRHSILMRCFAESAGNSGKTAVAYDNGPSGTASDRCSTAVIAARGP